MDKKVLLKAIGIALGIVAFEFYNNISKNNTANIVTDIWLLMPVYIIVFYFSLKRAYETRNNPNLPFIDGEMLFKMMGLCILWMFILASLTYILERIIFKQNLWWI